MFRRRFQRVHYAIVTLLFAAVGLVLSQPASAANISINLLNHPDANQDPPPYGLRLDELFLQTPTVGSVTGGVGGVTTFSFDPADGASMVLATSGVFPNIQINISGTVFGGQDTGVAYGFGAGLYDVDFTYTMNVTEVAGPDGGFIVSPNNIMNTGTITAQAGIAGVNAGTFWTIYDQTDDANNAFKVLADGHRLGSFPALLALDPFVGRGWVTFNSNGTNSSGTQDWIFTPEPTSLALMCIGGAALFARRPRRRRA